MPPNQTKKVLVTGIGGNVGQGILRNIRKFYGDKICVLGTDLSSTTAGQFFCDKTAQLPNYSAPRYIDNLKSLCKREGVDLIIPATDGEVVSIGKHADDLPDFVGSPTSTTSMCLDKFESFNRFHNAQLPFADSCLPSAYDDRWDQFVVKPREGRGSRDIHYLTQWDNQFDDTFVIQEHLVGQEITIAFYRSRSGNILGPLTLQRELHSGMTWKCSVTEKFSKQVDTLIRAFDRSFEVIGPCNIQAVATSEDTIIPFELNCRYSGTNSFRSHFGFSDVKYGIDEFLFNIEPEPEPITSGSALRLVMDVVYPDTPLDQVGSGNKDGLIF